MATEDLTTYTEVDPGSDYTVTSTTIDVSGLKRNIDAYVYKDFGAAYFDGDFIHYYEMNAHGATNGIWYNWGLANIVDDFNGIDSSSGDLLAVNIYSIYPSTVQLRECDAGTIYFDSGTINNDTLYYFTVERDESVGTYGTLYCRIYSDEAKTTLVDTLTVALHSSKKDYQYFYAANSHNSGTTENFASGSSQNYDLNTASGGVSVTPGVASFAMSAVAPSVVLGSVSISPAVAALGVSAVAPSVVLGSFSISPAVASLILSALDPTVNVGGNTIVTPAAASLALSALDPTVDAGGSVSVSPAIASMVMSALAPTVVKGSVSISPLAAVAIISAIDPIVSSLSVLSLVNVTVRVSVPNAVVRAALDRADKDNAMVVANSVEQACDASGEAVLSLWPTVLGSEGARYLITITHPETGELLFRTTTAIPNNAVNLWDIAKDEKNTMH